MNEIKRQYTRSEMTLMAWDSREKSYHMHMRYNKSSNSPSGSDSRLLPSGDSNGVRETNDSYELPEGINNGVAIPKTFFNTEGEIDLRQVTGPVALKYLQAVGLSIAVRM